MSNIHQLPLLSSAKRCFLATKTTTGQIGQTAAVRGHATGESRPDSAKEKPDRPRRYRLPGRQGEVARHSYCMYTGNC